MTRVLFDINVLLDVLLDRSPHANRSAVAWAAVEKKMAEGMISAHAVTTIHYLARKQLGPAGAHRVITALTGAFQIAAVDAGVIREALQLRCPDFEDAVNAAAARLAGCSYIVTRAARRFRGSAGSMPRTGDAHTSAPPDAEPHRAPVSAGARMGLLS